MRIVAKRTLQAFVIRHPQARQSMLAWCADADKSRWTTPQQIRAAYASASFVGRNRVVFKLHGNAYRLIVAIAWQVGVVYVKFVGTHAEYDRVAAATVEMN